MSRATRNDAATRPGVRWWQAIGAGLAHAALLALAFPPLGFWPAALAVVVPLAWVGGRTRRPAIDGLWASLGVLPFWLWSQRWVIPITELGYVPMTAHLALFTWPVVWVLGRASSRFAALPMALLVPVAWCGVEFFRGSVAWTGYAWLLLGHPLVGVAPARWSASWLGAYFVSGAVAAVGGLVADVAFTRGRWRWGLAAAAPWAAVVVAAVAAWALSGGEIGSRERVRLAVVQTNVPQSNKIAWTPERRYADWERLAGLTRLAAASDPDVIVWPETMFPGHSLDGESVAMERAAGLFWTLPGGGHLPTTAFADELVRLQAEVGVPMVVGAVATEGLRLEPLAGGGVRQDFAARYNSAFLVDGGRVAEERYDKLSLTPFGEVMPYISNWPWLERMMLDVGARGMSFDLAAGERPVRLAARRAGHAEVRIATPICFEVLKPDVCRMLVFGPAGRAADVLVNLSNFGWFGDFDAAREHAVQIARWRAAELGTSVVVAANTGISAAIDPRGRILAAGVGDGRERARVDGVLIADVPMPGPGRTLYSRIGDTFGWLMLAGAAGLAAGTFVGAGRGRRGGDGGGD